MARTRSPEAADADAQRAVIANFADGLLGIGDQVEENLRQLAGIAENGGQVRAWARNHGNAIGAQRMLVELQAALDQIAQVHAGLARLRRPGEGQQALHDLRGAARLAVSEVELPPRSRRRPGNRAAVR